MGVGVGGWSLCILGQNVGSAEVVGYLQEEGNVSGNALTHLAVIRQQLCFVEGAYLYRHTFVTVNNRGAWPASGITGLFTQHWTPPALESPQNIPLAEPPQMAYHEARVVLQLPGAKFPSRRPETEVIRSGLHKGTLFRVIQRITSSSQPFWI